MPRNVWIFTMVGRVKGGGGGRDEFGSVYSLISIALQKNNKSERFSIVAAFVRHRIFIDYRYIG